MTKALEGEAQTENGFWGKAILIYWQIFGYLN
jgi:hypothetical protein